MCNARLTIFPNFEKDLLLSRPFPISSRALYEYDTTIPESLTSIPSSKYFLFTIKYYTANCKYSYINNIYIILHKSVLLLSIDKLLWKLSTQRYRASFVKEDACYICKIGEKSQSRANALLFLYFFRNLKQKDIFCAF